MPAAPQFCPGCFALIPASAGICPECGADPAQFGGRDYREKLLTALHHPLAEVRLRAIIALGWRREPQAAQALVDCAMRHPVDVVEGLQVVSSLSLIEDCGVQVGALDRLARFQPAHAVRAAATRALVAISGGATEGARNDQAIAPQGWKRSL